jgi:hypothetical protein
MVGEGWVRRENRQHSALLVKYTKPEISGGTFAEKYILLGLYLENFNGGVARPLFSLYFPFFYFSFLGWRRGRLFADRSWYFIMTL